MSVQSLADEVRVIERKRTNALESQNPLKYTSLCDELGLSKEGIEDQYLYERGLMESEDDAKRKTTRPSKDLTLTMHSYSRKTRRSNSKEDQIEDSEYWAGLAKIALSRFRPTQRGERIRRQEIITKLRNLKQAGYHVEHYSKMKLKTLKQYLAEVRTSIEEGAQEYCPQVLNKIRANNAQMLKESLL